MLAMMLLARRFALPFRCRAFDYAAAYRRCFAPRFRLMLPAAAMRYAADAAYDAADFTPLLFMSPPRHAFASVSSLSPYADISPPCLCYALYATRLHYAHDATMLRHYLIIA